MTNILFETPFVNDEMKQQEFETGLKSVVGRCTLGEVATHLYYWQFISYCRQFNSLYEAYQWATKGAISFRIEKGDYILGQYDEIKLKDVYKIVSATHTGLFEYFVSLD